MRISDWSSDVCSSDLPGDRLTMFETPSPLAANSWDGHYYCNGQLLGISLSQAHNGLKLTHLKWSGVIPAGMAYVGSTHPRGFDSRYFRLLPIHDLIRMERILRAREIRKGQPGTTRVGRPRPEAGRSGERPGG